MKQASSLPYKAYLASREWALLKRRVFERSQGRCERCTFGRHEETHHLTYERMGHERLEDLQGVCRACHAYESGESDFDPRERIQQVKDSIRNCGDGPIEAYRAYADRLQFDPESLAIFNLCIQELIKSSDSQTAVKLAVIKFDTNKAFNQARRPA